MRVISTQEAKVLASPAQSVALRVQVKDAGGSWVNLSALYGYDWVRSVDYESTVDSPFATASVSLGREEYALSLAPLMTASQANAGGALIELRRELKVETATLPEGLVADGSTTWRIVFHGVIDDIDAASPTLTLKATDLGVRLQDAFIEEERIYGRWAKERAIRVGTVVKRSTDPLQGVVGVQAWRCTTAGTTGSTEPSWPGSPSSGTTQSDGTVTWTYQAAAAWGASSARTAGAIAKESAKPLRYWTCITSGTTGGSEPSWPSSPTQGQQVTDGSVTWAYTAGLYGTPAEVLMQSLIDDTLGAGVVALSCPVSPGWYVGEYRQQRTTVWDALQALSRQLGWELRYAWSESDGAFVLRLSSIDRAPSSVVASLSPDRYLDVRRASRAVDAIRNAVQVVWWNAEVVDPITSAPKQMKAQAIDSASIAAYGRRWMEVAEASASAIATEALATQFAAAMLSDLSQPVFDHELECLYLWSLELNDYVRCLANGRTYDLDQDLAVVGLRHHLEQGGQRTSLQMRGKPTAGVARYHDVAVAPRNAPAPRTLAPNVPAEVTVTPHAIGGQVIWQQPSGRILPPGTTVEAHLSATSGFTPDASTYRGDIAGGRLELSGLSAGTTYYLRTAYRSREGNLSDYSTERSLTPTQVAAADVEGLSAFSVKARATIDASFTNDSPIAFGTEDWDQGGVYASSILTVPAGAAGKWRIQARVHVTGAQAGDRLRAFANLNAGTRADLGPWAQAVEAASGSIELVAVLDTTLDLAVGNTIQVGTLFVGGSTTKTVKAPVVSGPFNPSTSYAGTIFIATRVGS